MKCCEAYAAALSAFVDGELDEQERGELLAHVEHCPNCRDALSELMILRGTIAGGAWWLVAGMLLLLCIVIYSFCSRMIRLCYQPNQDELHPSKADRALSWSALSLLAAAMVLGLWQPEFLRELIDQIATL